MARRPGKSAAEIDSDVEHCRDDLNIRSSTAVERPGAFV